ncbi:hypothetical protein CNBF0550 [Cryptococcus deneoformans B-3501A]|uniref:Nodulin-like domain-containing protein n=1 Tax=Cryptococcus deneoformans (strain JEC21 / ATCC MYA-565) TaxID=214684 RepID=Q5KET4_CRYD1|nr:conserved hypothetical protein [Cryptococcus neoformans var. neoformans JEC21]XP_774890.1 hypothetical protein CNBF0550 [Cryptococcus neoformans var. neoformans B-3501A]AAW44083.1 conserved hypothetical protein [Cryptococcus neoformans var. neoformans JEC21]EAL20243.1 hypothetical protein CNBF0550 [Cryptococcus neoformans var. neoformans B-3501A]
MEIPSTVARQSSRTRLIPENQHGPHLSKEITPGARAMSLERLIPFRNGWSAVERRRAGVFATSVVVGLASGSNYGYSAYAPQLASQLVISATLVNLIGLAGNFGMYTSGPVWGKIVDSKGQKIPLLAGGLCCLLGYGITHAFYTHIIPLRSPSSDDPSYLRLSLLLFAMFLTGCGGSAGLTSGVNAVAKSFPDSTRASATGAVLAGFGLSAFLFSALGHLFWPGDSGGLLALLTVGTGGPMLFAAFIVRAMPPEGEQSLGPPLYEQVEQDEDGDGMGVEVAVGDYGSPTFSRSSSFELSRSMEFSRSRSPAARGRHIHPDPDHPQPHAHFGALPPSHNATHKPPRSRSSSLSSLPPTLLTHSPVDLIKTVDFWLLFIILAVLSGTGLMYINNAGTVVLALAREGKRVYNKEKIGGWQAKQVGLVSIWNCAGRILGGVYSDFCKTHFQIRRIWALPLVACLFIVSQLSALSTTHAQSLWIVSSLLGLAYGALFNVMPMLILEWFGMRHFSQNWGWTAVAPIIGSNTFNVLFGSVYDANSVGRIGSFDPEGTDVSGVMGMMDFIKRGGVALPDDGSHDCLMGEECYGLAFKLSFLGCILALVLSVLAGVRREKMSKERRGAILARRTSSDEV